ncbi:MAG: NADH-quinone oxidoreductase subunit A [Ignavibacteria bacterium]|nr:NADH-quinone oxidoreductase subunit A [Ignavibacteria bacterium]
MLEQYIPLFLVIGFAIVLATVLVALSKLLGPQRPTAEKLTTYESGVQPIGSAHERVSVKYYLVAMFFIIFDLEVIFVYPWAVEFKRLIHEIGIVALYSMLVFLFVFEIGFLYAYKKGGFKWD